MCPPPHNCKTIVHVLGMESTNDIRQNQKRKRNIRELNQSFNLLKKIDSLTKQKSVKMDFIENDSI